MCLNVVDYIAQARQRVRAVAVSQDFPLDLREDMEQKWLLFMVTMTVAVRCCCISALLLNCFRLKKGRAMFFRPETIVASYLHSMVLLSKVLFNH